MDAHRERQNPEYRDRRLPLVAEDDEDQLLRREPQHHREGQADQRQQADDFAVRVGQFAQVVSIRNKRLHGKKLDKAEQEFVRSNPDLVTLPKHKLTSAEEEFFKSLGV